MRVNTLALTLIISMLGTLLTAGRSDEVNAVQPTEPVIFQENFASNKLDLTRWQVFRHNDFHESTIDIVDGRLRLRADTMDTDIDTVKFHGIRTVDPVVDIQHPAGIRFDLNWEEKENGSFMDSGIFLCPTVIKGTPEDEPNWLRVMYIGSDGPAGRIEITARTNGDPSDRMIYDEGFRESLAESAKHPMEKQPKFVDHQLGLQQIRLVLSQKSIAAWENNKQLCAVNFKLNEQFGENLPWTKCYLYMLQSSQANYAAREVSFRHLAIQSLPAQPLDEMTTMLTIQPAVTAQIPPAIPGVPFAEHFTDEQLDWTRWTLCRKNDFRVSTMEVVGNTKEERRLRLRADTIGTSRETMKYHGLRTTNPVINLQKPTEITCDLDWNHPDNDSYQSAGIYICPTATAENPKDQPDYVRVTYVGVPFAASPRLEVMIRVNKSIERILFNEGWATPNMAAEQFAKHITRQPGLQHLRIVISQEVITVWENEKQIYTLEFAQHRQIARSLSWSTAYLYLQQETACNFLARDVFFDNVTVCQLDEQ